MTTSRPRVEVGQSTETRETGYRVRHYFESVRWIVEVGDIPPRRKTPLGVSVPI